MTQGYAFGGPRAEKVRRNMAAIRENGRIDRFAEHLADGLSPGDAAVALGMSKKWGNNTMQRIRSQLGWQAR